jgi:uncharacterized repeat protein (TIGR04138 family)
MQKLSLAQALEQILKEDPRYDAEAYLFVKEALDYTVKALNKPADGPNKHVTGTELLDGIRAYAIGEYGPMTLRVLTTWGVKRCEDFGDIVFNLVDKGVLGKSTNDHKTDFTDGYDFLEAFAQPFLPASASRTRRTSEDPQYDTQKTVTGGA